MEKLMDIIKDALFMFIISYVILVIGGVAVAMLTDWLEPQEVSKIAIIIAALLAIGEFLYGLIQLYRHG